MAQQKSTTSQTLTAAVLPSRNLIFEWEPIQTPRSSDREQIESRLFDLYSSHPEKAMLALGAVSAAIRLSPSMEYWRALCAAYIHELLVDPKTESLREKQIIDMSPETAAEWAGRVPEMVGADRVDARKARDLGIAVEGGEAARDPEAHRPRLPDQREQLRNGERTRQVAAAALLQFRERRVGAEQPVARVG